MAWMNSKVGKDSRVVSHYHNTLTSIIATTLTLYSELKTSIKAESVTKSK